MSPWLLGWLVAVAWLLRQSARSPAWSASLYVFVYFTYPNAWSWGRGAIGDIRWSLFLGLLLLGQVWWQMSDRLFTKWPGPTRLQRVIIAMLLNAMIVHFLLASNWGISSDPLMSMVKFGILALVMVAAIRTKDDFTLVVTSMSVGICCMWAMIVIGGAGNMVAGRLEGVGPPGASGANLFGSLLVTCAPIAGALTVVGNRYQKWIGGAAVLMALHIIVMCNSRGTFLAVFAAAAVLVSLLTGRLRRKVALTLGSAALIGGCLLVGEHVINRFMTTFAQDEQRDWSAASRLVFWQAGLKLIVDHPLGAGGAAFKKVHGSRYLAQVGEIAETRSVHNGYINEACEWGLQGLWLRLTLFATALAATRKVTRARTRLGDSSGQFLGVCLVSATAAFLVTCLFGDMLDAEWGFWLVALSASYVALFSKQITLASQRTGQATVNLSQPAASVSASTPVLQKA